MSVSSSTLERLGGGALFDALRVAADRGKLGLALAFLDSEPPQMIFLNDYPARMLGYSPIEVERAGFWVFVAPEEVPRLREHFGLLGRAESAPKSFETIALTKGGKRIPIEMTLSDVELDGRRATVAFFSDVSERWRALSALQESEERFRLVVEGAPDGVAILDGARIRFLNPRAARLLGLRKSEDGYGRLITEFLHPDDVSLAGSRISELLRTGEPNGDPVEYRSRNAEGEELVIEVSAIPIEIGGERAVLGFARDVTERKAIQARLAEAERLTALGVLSAGVAHEINNPLAYVLLNLEYLKRELPKLGEMDERLADLMVRLSDACHGAERVATIVRDLRTFARGDDSIRGPVELSSVMNAAISIAGNALKYKATLVREFDDAPLVEGNPNRLEQVFLNLLLNAAQALPDNSPESQRIVVRLYGRDDQVVTEVEDTGEGIPENLRTRIFEPFFTTKPVGVGTGLGLPICRSIVAAHGGSIEVESEVKRGTLFRVCLPASRATQQDARRKSTESPPLSGQRGRVLVIDDELTVASTLKLVLEQDHDIAVATSAEQALRMLESAKFGAIVCDLMMPGMSGMDLYAAIRRLYPGLERRMVFMTGGAALSHTQAFLEEVPNPLLEKPFDMALLRATLAEVLELSAEW